MLLIRIPRLLLVTGGLVVLATHLCGQALSTTFKFGGSGTTLFFPRDGSFYDTAQSIAIDASGNMYIAGTAYSADFPQVNALAPITGFSSCFVMCIFQAPFIAKIDAAGSRLIYSTILGVPTSDAAFPTLAFPNLSSLVPIAVAVDSGGNAYITGTTSNANFPGVKGLSPKSSGGADAFLVKLDPNGNLISSMLFGGSADDAGNAIALDSAGTIYIAGTTKSPDFPTTSGAYRNQLSSTQDLFLTTLSSSTGKILTSTYLGPGTAPHLALIPGGQVYVAASTTSADWPTTAGAFQPGCPGSPCAGIIALKFDLPASKILFATYLGGNGTNTLSAVAAGPDDSLFLTGLTNSSAFPVTAGAFSTQADCPQYVCSTSSFVTHLNDTGTTALYSTYLKGKFGVHANAIAVDTLGDAYVAGQTSSTDLPVLHAVQPNFIPAVCGSRTPSGGIGRSFFCASGGFVSALNPSGSSLNWSTFLGGNGSAVYGLAFDSSGSLYATGEGIALAGTYRGGSASAVKFTSQNPVLEVTAQSITNSASYATGLPFGGGLATIFLSGLSGMNGILSAQSFPLPTEIAGVSVKVNGELAPILAVASTESSQQINFQVPFDQQATTAVLQISQNNNSVFLGAQPVASGIFVLPDGSPAIQHAADYSLVTAEHPVIPGETITIYATGLGDTVPGSQTGLPFTKALPLVYQIYQPYVSIGSNASCAILYAGPTPGFIGLYQINCKTPAQLSSGRQRLQISMLVPILLPALYSLSNLVSLAVQ